MIFVFSFLKTYKDLGPTYEIWSVLFVNIFVFGYQRTSHNENILRCSFINVVLATSTSKRDEYFILMCVNQITE